MDKKIKNAKSSAQTARAYFLTGAKYNLITDCLNLDGHPGDTELTRQILDRHKEIYGHYPIKVALDGGFASYENQKSAKGKGIKDDCFAKKCGFEQVKMCRSSYLSRISWLKR